ncbi:MAG: hypothetical protein GXP17_10335 [Gammaproteobacteria bacterium]|nr:hypothetical protein [Gammaproteobacteria bacterium]
MHTLPRRFFVFAALLLSGLLLGGCSTTADRMDRLDRTLNGYEKALRWGKFDAAYSFHKWGTDEQPSIPAHLKKIRMTRYEVTSRRFDEKTMTARQSVAIRYYDTDTATERELQDRQRWKYFEDAKRWYLMSDPPVFK